MNWPHDSRIAGALRLRELYMHPRIIACDPYDSVKAVGKNSIKRGSDEKLARTFNDANSSTVLTGSYLSTCAQVEVLVQRWQKALKSPAAADSLHGAQRQVGIAEH